MHRQTLETAEETPPTLIHPYRPYYFVPPLPTLYPVPYRFLSWFSGVLGGWMDWIWDWRAAERAEAYIDHLS